MRRVVTSYSLHRSASGRLSSGVDSAEPDKLRGKVTQVQNIPKPVRDIIVPLPGHVLVQGDWAAIEWAISMWMASKHDKDRFHLDILDKFQAGEFDPHRYLASFVYEKPESEIDKAERDTCKPYTHGRTYLGWEEELARKAGHQAKLAYMVCGVHEEAFRVHPWQQEVLASVKKKHYVQTPLGWRRYFWGVQKNRKDLEKLFGKYTPKPAEVIATLVSGTAADLCKVVLGTVFAELPEGWEVLTSTHDSIMLMVPDGKPWMSNDSPMAWLKAKMEQPIPWLDGRSWRADVRVGNNWREVS